MDGSYVSPAERRVADLRSVLWFCGQDAVGNRDATAKCLWELVQTSDALYPPQQVLLLCELSGRIGQVVLPPLWYESLCYEIAQRLIDLGEYGNGYIDGPVPTHVLAAAHEQIASYGSSHGLRWGEITAHRRRASELRHPFRHAALTWGVQIGAAIIEARYEQRRLDQW